MFWFSLFIAFFGGLAGTTLFRERVKNHIRWIRDAHLNLVAFGLLSIGLIVSTIDFVANERRIATLESATQIIRSFEIELDISFTSDWNSRPPGSPRVMVMGRNPIVTTDIALKTGRVQILELFMDKDPSIGPRNDDWIHTIYRVKAEPGSWIVGSDIKKLNEIRKLILPLYGVSVKDSRDGIFGISASCVVFINGQQVCLIDTNPIIVSLNQISENGQRPELQFEGKWPIDLD